MRRFFLTILRPPYEWAKKHPPIAHIVFSFLEKINSSYDHTYRKKAALHISDIPPAEFLKDKVAVITVAFNKVELIENQIACFKKYASSNTYLIIADNSSDPKARQNIAALCQKAQVGYISLPPNPRKQINLSHSIALNWLYYNLVIMIEPFGFGFIDHDVLPLQQTDLRSILQAHPFYGLYQERKKGKMAAWYLWAGFSFFRYNDLKKAGVHDKMNFSSVVVSTWQNFLELDTGGGNWLLLYSKTSLNLVRQSVQEHKRVLATELQAEHLDGWIHLHGASQKSHEEIQKTLDLLFHEKSIH